MILEALAGAVLASGGAAQRTPDAAAAAFYRICQRDRSGGVPGPRQRARLRPILTPELSALLEDAARAEAHHTAATNNQEPPLIEGDLFTSLFEGASRARIEGCWRQRTRATCTVALVHREPRAKAVRWHDRVVLRLGPSGWRVDDILFGGTWDFGNKGSLSQTLKDATADAG